MFTTRGKTRLAGRLGRWSIGHPVKAILAWLALVLVAIVASSTGERLLSQSGESAGDSAKAYRLLERGFQRHAPEEVLLEARGGQNIRTASGRKAAAEVIDAVRATNRVRDARSPFAPGNGGQISKDGRSALVLFSMKGKADTADERVKPVVAAVERVADANPALRVEQFGEASAGNALNDTVGKDFKRAEAISIPLTFVILWVAFSSLVAALLPVALALSAILIATGLVTLTSHAPPIDQDAHSMILLIGLAVGVDAPIHLPSGPRGACDGGSNRDALAVAAATSGTAVLTSGLTVVAAMAAMFLTGLGTFIGMAEATAIVVIVAMLGSLTVLPALMALRGDRVERGRIPFLGRRRTRTESRVWAAIIRPALARPVVTVVLAAGFLVLLAVPALHLRTASPGVTDLPRSLAVVKTYDRIQHAFGDNPIPAQVVVSADNVDSPAVRAAIGNLKREALASGQMHQPISVDVNVDHTLARVSIPLVGDGTNPASDHALQTLRSSVVPKTVGSVGTTYVAVPTAASVDFNHRLSLRAPYVFAFVLGLAFLLLMWNFRSVVIPATAIVMNLLSVGAAYGVLVSVFQGGWGLVHVGGVHHGPIAAWLPLFLFVILFGLSMDYHVFILSRIREGHGGA